MAFLEKYTLTDLASFVGLLLTVVGFVITILNVRKTKRAAEAAEKAANEISNKISLVNVVVSLSAAMTSMAEIKRLHREGAWSLLLERYAAMRKALIEIRVHTPNLSYRERKLLQGAVTYFTDAENVMEINNGAPSAADVPRLNLALTKHVNDLTELLERLKTTVGGSPQ